MIIQVHDELVLEVPEAQLKKAEKICREQMVDAADLSVALAVDVKSGCNWGLRD